jgi:phage shock protein PspC (stress-responsive transcriptional regulator)
VKSTEQAVSISDINEIIEIIGNPSEIDDKTTGNDEFRRHFEENMNQPVRKRLYRDTDSKVIGGVCSGLGHYFNLDKVWIRVAFIILTILFANMGKEWQPIFIPLLYLILWIVVPRTKTPRQNIEMHGLPQKSSDSSSRREASFFQKFIRAIIQICVVFTLSIVGFVGFCMLVVGLATFFGGSIFGGENFVSILNYIYIGDISIWLAKILIGLVVFIPLFIIVYWSLKVLIRFRLKDKPAIIILWIVWAIALFFVGGHSISFAKQYRHRARTTQTIYFSPTDSLKNLNIQIADKNIVPYEFGLITWDETILYKNANGEKSMFISPEVCIRTVDSLKDCRIRIEKYAFAPTEYEAQMRANSMPDEFEFDGNTIFLKPQRYDKYNKWKLEHVYIYLYVPNTTNVNVIGDLNVYGRRWESYCSSWD